MARTLGCADVGYDCAFRITTEDNQDDFIVETTLKHAKAHHPELAAKPAELEETLKKHIRNLLEQAKYNKA